VAVFPPGQFWIGAAGQFEIGADTFDDRFSIQNTPSNLPASGMPDSQRS
jgi:hypothetical protein